MTTTIPTATAQVATPATPAARPAKTEVRQPKALPAPNSDFYEVYETLSAEELATVKRVRAFMEAKVAPVITKYWVDDAFPFELLPAVKELDIGGLGMRGTQVCLPGRFRADRAQRDLLLQIALLAGGTFRRRRRVQHQVLEPVSAVPAFVFKDRHE